MGSTCSPCNGDETGSGASNNVEPPHTSKKRTATKEGSDNINNYGGRGGYAQSVSYDEGDSDSSGYDGSTSHAEDEDSKSVPSSQVLTDHDIEIAYDGWQKAIESGNDTLATFYFEEYPNIDMLQFKWDDGDSALHVACKNKKARLVFFLLTQGAAVNEENTSNGCTPLHYAVQGRDEKIINLLLKFNADAAVMNKDKESPITIASSYRDKDIFNLLTENDSLSPSMKRMRTNTEIFSDLHQTAAMDEEEAVDDILGNIPENSTQNNYNNKDDDKKDDDVPEVDSLELKALKVGRSNPFTNLGRRGTKMAEKIVKEKLKQKPLPRLESWLEKRKPGGMVPTYQKRWIVVKGSHLLWSSKQRTIKNDADRKERKKFNGSLHLMTIESINAVDTQSANKFAVKAKDPKTGQMREYVFRCTNKRERDFWVNGLKEHKKQYETVLQYLGK